jgi:hypothetical protein
MYLFLRVQLGTVSVPTTVDAIDEVTGFSIASGAASATGAIIDNNNALLWQRSLHKFRLLKVMWYSTLLSNPSDQLLPILLVLTQWYDRCGLRATSCDVDVLVSRCGLLELFGTTTTADAIDSN